MILSFFSYFIRLVSSCLLSLMTTLEEEIRDMKAEIAKDTARRDKAVVEGDGAKEERLDNLITATRNQITALLQQQQQGE